MLLTMAASGLLLAACASNQAHKLVVTGYPPIVVDGYNTPSVAELYAQRYQSSVAQVKAGGGPRFVTCEQSCPGATPKTPMASLNAAVARRAQQNRRPSRAPKTAPPLTKSDEPSTTAVRENAAHADRYRDGPDDARGSTERK